MKCTYQDKHCMITFIAINLGLTLNIIKVILPDLIVMLQYQAIKVGMLDYLNSLLEEIINIPI